MKTRAHKRRLLRESAREHLDTRPLPIPRLVQPRYRVGEYGAWRLVSKKDHIAAVGYFRGMQWVEGTKQYALLKNETVWMSVSPMELESQAVHLAAARGEVVIMGLGMGALAYNVIAKPEVTRVTVVERDPDVITLIRRFGAMASWPGSDKLTVVLGDALHYTHPRRRPVDVLLADIWVKLHDERTIPDMQAMQKNLNAAKVGWWGQELDIISYLSTSGRQQPITDADLTAFAVATGLPFVGPVEIATYKQLIIDAGVNSLHPLTQNAAAWAWRD